MCMPQYTLERQDVLNLAINTLAQLPLSPRGDQIQVPDWLHVLVFAAASRIAVHQAMEIAVHHFESFHYLLNRQPQTS